MKYGIDRRKLCKAGLGLVAAAVHRYGGTIDVAEVAREGFAKAVVISFFRAA